MNSLIKKAINFNKSVQEKVIKINKNIKEQVMRFNKKIKINFEGGEISSDTGMVIYKEFDEQIGFSKTIKENLEVEDDSADSRIHKNEDIMIQRIYQKLAGYNTDDASDDLRYDPTFTKILNKEGLASQPTISRYNSRVTKKTIKSCQKINEKLQDKIYQIEKPKHFIFDLDSTNCETYGEQYGSDYNSHYGSNGYHPLMLFEGITGDFLKAELRSGDVYTSRNVVRFMGPILKKYNKEYPETVRVIRGDSGFAVPELYELAEEHDTLYIIRLKENPKLFEKATEYAMELSELCKIDKTGAHVVYGEFKYKATSWEIERKVAVKIERPAGEETIYKYTFIVNNMTLRPKETIELYFNRGSMENYIKECKKDLGIDIMSSTEYIANAAKLQEGVLAYNLNNWLRRTCLKGTEMETMRVETLRTKIMKIGSRVVRGARYITFKMSSSYPYKETFWEIMNKINKIVITA